VLTFKKFIKTKYMEYVIKFTCSRFNWKWNLAERSLFVHHKLEL